VNKSLTINQNKLFARQADAAGTVCGCGVTTSVPAIAAGLGGGKFKSKGFGYDRADRTPERIAKAQAFHARQNLARQNPANCCRCGKPRDGKTRQCSKCLKYQAKYRGKMVDKDAKLTGSVVVAMVKQVRREMTAMQARFKLWQKAANYRRNLHYRTNTMRKKYLKTASRDQAMDYLADTNHAYEKESI
jgi:hypothetical protein